MRLLLQAAAVRDFGNRLPCTLPLARKQTARRDLDSARCLLAASPARAVLKALASTAAALPLYPDFVIARLPLTEKQWALVPTCPGLGRALPAAAGMLAGAGAAAVVAPALGRRS